jgi:3-oxoadipate enol-lactonase
MDAAEVIEVTSDLGTKAAAHGAGVEGHGHAFERDGCRIHWWSAGASDAPTIVLTHGVTIDHGTFATQVPLLAAGGCRVVSWDLRGHGRSRPNAARFSIANAADDLHALLDEIGADQAVLVGQSFGGFVVQAVHRRHPARVAGLVLAGSLPLGRPAMWPLLALYGRLAPPIQRLWPEGHLRAMVPRLMSKRADVRQYVARANRPLDRGDFAAATEAATEGFVRYERLARIDVPTLCVAGDADLPFAARSVREWAARMPLVDVEVIEHAGHLVNQERPEAFSAAVVSFLDGMAWAAKRTPAPDASRSTA